MTASTPRKRVGVLLSGGGTNLQALIDAAAQDNYPAEIALVLSNNDDAFGLERARRAGIATAVVDHRGFADRPTFDAAIDTVLRDAGIEIVCLAGFLRVLTPDFVNGWRDAMLNIHPSLLPVYKGLHSHERVLEAGDALHGATVHLVRPELDDGPLLLQARVPVLKNDDPATLAARVLEQEHIIYPRALALLAEGRIEVRDGTAYIDGTPGPVILAP
ncbi:MAG: phosphoribosylglycinamide formyltransferase [Alphaproteobacteria bacterium]